MIASEGWLNPTRAAGLAAYGLAAACSAIAWRRMNAAGRNSRLAAVLTVLESVLLLDIAFSWRWMLHGLADDFAQSRHEYGLRRGPQFVAVVLLCGLLLFGLVMVARAFHRRPGALLAAAGALLSVIVWCVEVVSLHEVDHILYHLVGPLMAVSLLWICAALMTSSGMLIESRPRSAPRLRR